jgi:hypothetical protein
MLNSVKHMTVTDWAVWYVELQQMFTQLPSTSTPVEMLLTCIWRYPVQISAWTPTIPAEVFCGFSQSLEENAGAVPSLKPWLLPSTSFIIPYSVLSNHSTLYSQTKRAGIAKFHSHLKWSKINWQWMCWVSSQPYSKTVLYVWKKQYDEICTKDEQRNTYTIELPMAQIC